MKNRTPEQLVADNNRKFNNQLTNWLPLQDTIKHLDPFFRNEQEIGVDYCIKRNGNTAEYAIYTTGEFITTE